MEIKPRKNLALIPVAQFFYRRKVNSRFTLFAGFWIGSFSKIA